MRATDCVQEVLGRCLNKKPQGQWSLPVVFVFDKRRRVLSWKKRRNYVETFKSAE